MSRQRVQQPKADGSAPASLSVSLLRRQAGLQRKLSVGASNDPLEHEADRVAEQVLSGTGQPTVGAAPPAIRRASPSAAPGFAAPASVHRVLEGPGRSLDGPVRADMEQRFGRDFSQVRVHQGGAAEASARAVDAHAYTAGNHIVFGAGGFAPHSRQGRLLLAHELTHVVQQEAAGPAGATVVRRAPIDDVRTRMSYSAGDWAIRDYEAMEALALLGEIPPADLAAELVKLGSKYVTRLLDNLPDAAKTGDLYQRVIVALGPAGVTPYADDLLDTGFFSDWAVTDAEVNRVFNTFTNLPAAAREDFLDNLRQSKKLDALISNCDAGHHALYIRPWISTLTAGALTQRQIDILRVIVKESDNDQLATLKLATATRFNVTVDRRPIPNKVDVEWDPAQLRETYLVLDQLPEAHVAGNTELLHLAQFNKPAEKTSIVAGVYYGGRAKMLTINVVASEGFANTVMHETAHAVDQKLGWSTGPEPATPQRGGWKNYGTGYVACATDMVDDSAGGIKTDLDAAQRTDVIGEMAKAMTNRSAAGLEGAIRNLAWFAALPDAAKDSVINDKALSALRIGLTEPWMKKEDVSEHLGPHNYHESYPGIWVRYLHAARVPPLLISAYQFRDEGEWFAECYAAYYEPDKRGKGAKLNDADPNTKVYFDTVVDKMARSR